MKRIISFIDEIRVSQHIGSLDKTFFGFFWGAGIAALCTVGGGEWDKMGNGK